jgi:hypothetical protein
MTVRLALFALLAALGLAAWLFRYEPVESGIPAVRIVWDRLGHRYCRQQLIPPEASRTTFDQAWEARGASWSLSELRCD